MNQSRKKRPTTHRRAPLRERAEALLKQSPAPNLDWCGDDPRNLVYELRVHQAELEMQNEELRRAQIDLETSRDRFAHLYDLAPVGYLTLAPEGVIREANQAAARLLGLDHRALLNQELTAFIAAGSQDDFYLHRQRVFAAVAPQSCELQMRRRGEGEFTCRLESVVDADGKGVASQCLVAMSDVTRQRLAEEAMRKSRAQLDGIVRSAMDAIITVNSRQRIILCNEAAERMFGHPPGRLVGRPLRDLIPKTARRTHARWVRTFGTTEVTNGKMEALDQVFGLRADGTEFPIEASISRVELGGERLFTAVLRDITERLRAEETLRRSESELADFFAKSPLGMLWVGGDGRVLRVNRAFLGMLGYAEEEVAGHSVAEFHPDPEVASAALERLANRETLSSHRALLRHRDGSLRHVSINANGHWEDSRLVHSRWFITDKTRQVDLEREILTISELEQQRLGRELHDDVCQQLTCIEFLAHGLEQELAATSTIHSRRASQIARLLREANSRVRDLSHGLAPIHMDAGGLIGALENLALRTRQVFDSHCTVLADQTVAVDDPEVRLHLYRIAQEAVSNAVKHGRAKRIDIRLRETGDRLVLGVHDNGSGLPTTPARGKGLGLRLMKYRAGLIHGSVAVQREASGGTSVVCSLHSGKPRPQVGKSQ